MEKKWCMCTEIRGVSLDGFSTCDICGGKDAYGGSSGRGVKYSKKIVIKDKKRKQLFYQLEKEYIIRIKLL
jgi:hypothetical protein